MHYLYGGAGVKISRTVDIAETICVVVFVVCCDLSLSSDANIFLNPCNFLAKDLS